MTRELTFRRPDDWHLHLRDGGAMAAVLPYSAARFARALVMPNLKPPVTTVAEAIAYRERILAALTPGADFTPYMALYLTDRTAVEEIGRIPGSGCVLGCKLYPAGATTFSEHGVTNFSALEPVLEAMQRLDVPLMVHGEVTDERHDVFDREARFIDEVLAPLSERYTRLRIVFEHITTAAAVAFVRQARPGIAATITPQHLLYNRNALLAGGIRPHYYCLPLLKTEADRQALIGAVASGEERFFLGTDSAPHAREAKESACGCAGSFSAPAAIELYAELFEREGILERLPAFAAEHGAAFYRLARNSGHIRLVRTPWRVATHLPYAGSTIVPLCAGEQLHWQLAPVP